MRGTKIDQPVYRHEEKFLISTQEYMYLKKLLGSVLKGDKNAAEGGRYFIRSLYFDTMSNVNFHQKEDGVQERRKIRLRVYDENARFAKLEIKNKVGAGIYKESVSIKRGDADSMAKGNFSVLLGYRNPTALRVYRLFKTQCYRPAVLIDYEREAFVVPVFTGRITFDTNIRAASGRNGLSTSQKEMKRLFSEPKVILEVKYNHMLPEHIKSLLGSSACVPMAVSKYCMGRTLMG